MKLAKIIYSTYHALFPSTLRTCRFDPTCSKYFLESTEKYGLLKGSALTFTRVLSCHPFTKRPILDPVK